MAKRGKPPIWEILAEVVRRAEIIKPSQQAKRDVLDEYGVSGTKLDRVLTKLYYQIMRYSGIVDKIICRITGCENVNILDPYLRAALRVAVYMLLFERPSSKKREAMKEQIFNWIKNNTHPGCAYYFSDKFDEILSSKSLLKSQIDKKELKYLLPAWFIKKMQEILKSETEVEQLAKAFMKIPKISVRVNMLKSDPDRVKAILENNYGKKVSYGKYLKCILKFDGPFDFNRSELWKKGIIIIQEEAAALASVLLDPKPGQTIVDMCAAPGGKTEHIAELMQLKGKIYAFDIDDLRIQRMKDLLKRTGTDKIVKIYKYDARKAHEKIGEEVADKVLLDAPCTSDGTIHKNPELRWRLREENVEALARLQRELLDAAARLVKPGGEILYCTCSLLKEENEDNVKWFLKKHKEFELVPLPADKYGSHGLIRGTIRMWPHRDNTIGFFYAKFRKKESA